MIEQNACVVNRIYVIYIYFLFAIDKFILKKKKKAKHFKTFFHINVIFYHF